MAHLVRHLPPTWEFVRCESVEHQKRREVIEKQHVEIDKSRTRSDLWWTEQRYVDQVTSSHNVNPDHLDTFNYRYQVFARPQKAQQSEDTCKLPHRQYDIKRIAVDKVWTPGARICDHHWSKHPLKIQCCLPNIKENIDHNCNRNNNMYPILSRYEVEDLCNRNLSNTNTCKNTDEDGSFILNRSCDQEDCQSLDRDCKHKDDCYPLDVYRETVHHEDKLNMCKQGYSSAMDKIDSCSGSVCNNNPGIINLSNRLTHRSCGIPKSNVANNRKYEASISSNELNLACVFENDLANCNKNHVSGNTVTGFILNENNDRSADLTRESDIIFIDNLVGIDMNNTENLFCSDDIQLVKTPQYIDGYLVSHEQFRFLMILPQSFHFVYDYCLCQNNNAECVYDSNGRPQCVPGHYRENDCFSVSPHPTGIPLKTRSKSYTNRKTPCMEMTGHLESNVRSRCLNDPEESPNRRCETYPRDGFDDYVKIIGGRQSRLPPPKDYLSNIKLPPNLEEYREFTRRCPNPAVGRYDQSDPANEMLLPCHKAINTMYASRNPFTYLRNPRCYTYQPLFHEPKQTDGLCWHLPSYMSRS